jgi:hypothetical protein
MTENARVWEVARFAGDGYDRAGIVRKVGFEPISAWGRDGWDLGDWPYVMVFGRLTARGFEVVVNCEGDAFTERFDTLEDRNAYIDGIALDYWRMLENGPDVSKVGSVEEMPAEYRGPFSWKRLDREGNAPSGAELAR